MTRKTTNAFDWAIYADATLAGLSVLIPLPFVDSIAETYFRNRMIRSIARHHQQVIDPKSITLEQSTWSVWRMVRTVFFWPFRFVIDLVLRLSRKILYFLSIKRAIDALNTYWQRAYLLNYMIGQGHLRSEVQSAPALLALSQVLDEHSTSPLTTLARELVHSPARLVRSVRHARRGTEDQGLVETERTMRNAWGNYDTYFRRLQERYEQLYQTNLHLNKV